MELAYKLFYYIYNYVFRHTIEAIISFFEESGRYLFFLKETIKKTIQYSPHYKETLYQIYEIGIKSIPVVSVSGFFIGAIVSINLYKYTNMFGAETILGGLNVSSSFRELTPIFISFIIACKVGIHTTAELGAMKISDEIDTMRSLAIDPIRYLIVPRFIAVIFSSFSLLLIGFFMSFLGGLFFATLKGINPIQYTVSIPHIVTVSSFIYAIIKCLIFGFIVSSIACFQGFTAREGSLGLRTTIIHTAEILIVTLIFVDYLLATLANFITEFFAW